MKRGMVLGPSFAQYYLTLFFLKNILLLPSIQPAVLPLQILRIGQLVILAVPGGKRTPPSVIILVFSFV
jgi:hypothetical protein